MRVLLYSKLLVVGVSRCNQQLVVFSFLVSFHFMNLYHFQHLEIRYVFFHYIIMIIDIGFNADKGTNNLFIILLPMHGTKNVVSSTWSSFVRTVAHCVAISFVILLLFIER